MTGPNAERSSGDGELAGDVVIGDALLGDATALMTGGLVAGATLDGGELGRTIGEADEAGGRVEIGALDAAAAEWCDPEHADTSSTLTTTAGAHQPDVRRRAR
jgi:hypothetical protein